MGFVVVAVTALFLVVPVELPDKTFVATLVLSTRYRGWPVWLGAVAAFGVQCLVAVAAGQLISLLPERPVLLLTAGLFAVGAVVLLRSALRAHDSEREQEREYERRLARRFGPQTRATGERHRRVLSAPRTALASFLVIFMAEWGDLSQLLTAGLVARDGQPIAVFAGAWSGLAMISAGAVLLGRMVLRYVSLTLVQAAGALICAALSVLTLLAALNS